MLDRLEQHIRDNREALDTLEPDMDRLWSGVEKQLPRQARVRRLNWKEPAIRWAASLLVAVSVGIGWNVLQPGAAPAIAFVEAEATTPSGLPAEFANMEAYYRDAINQHRAQLVAYHEEGITLDDQFSVDLDQLLEDYQQLQTELPQSENPEVIIDAMVQNLTTQLEVLQQQLRILETIKKANQSTHEAVQI